MNQRAVIQDRTDIKDDTGDILEISWTNFLDIWCCLGKDSSGISVKGGGLKTERRKTFITRFKKALATKDIGNSRFVYKGMHSDSALWRAYGIESIEPYNGQNNYLEIKCNGNDWEAV